MRAVIIAAGAASVAITVWAGRHNRSALVIAVFAVWVALPFVYAAMRRATAVALISLGVYAIAAPKPWTQVFLLAPPVSAIAIRARDAAALRRGRDRG